MYRIEVGDKKFESSASTDSKTRRQIQMNIVDLCSTRYGKDQLILSLEDYGILFIGGNVDASKFGVDILPNFVEIKNIKGVK